MILRPYQQDFNNAVARGFHEGFHKQLGVLPTGGGKTVCFAHQAFRFHSKRQEKTLVLAHREELIYQAADKIEKAVGLVASVEKANQRADMTAPVVVASIQTMQGARLQAWPTDHFGLIVCDEAHHCLAPQWQRTLNHFGARVLGVTATPDRGDKKLLSTYFENLAYECNILDLIRQGHLSKVRIQSVPLKIDLANVPIEKGDFDANALDAAIRPYLSHIARHIADKCGDRKRIVAFLPLIQTSLRFVDECRAVGIDAVHIDGASPDRREILRDYGAGKIRLLSNAMLLTEGWDEPGVDCLLVLRPTRSRGLYSQMVGRGTRLCEGKADLLLLDFLWLHEKHDLCRPASLVAKDKEEETQITAQVEGKEIDLEKAIEDAAAEREAAVIRRIAENAARRERFISLEDVGTILKDEKIRDYSPIFKWETAKVSDKQQAVLDRFGIQCQTRGEAVMVMNKLFDRSKKKLATVGQMRWLVRFKHPSPDTCTAAEAKAFLAERFGR